MKKIIFIICIILNCFNSELSAQRPHFSPQDYIKSLESFIAREACLTPQEAESFFPIFHEMHNKQRGINWKINELKKRTLSADAPDKEYYNLVKKITELKIESAELEESYYKKLCKIVPAKKVHASILAEDNFHRKMLKRFSPNGSRKKK